MRHAAARPLPALLLLLAGTAWTWTLPGTSTADTPKPATDPAQPAFFRERVAPVLEKRCVRCHGDEAPKGGLSLTRPAALLKGGESGPAVVPGKADESALIEQLTGNPPAMPQKDTPLTPAQVADLSAWIDRGAVWPDGLTLRDRRFEGETWWAFTPLNRPAVPRVATTPDTPALVRNPIDAFVLDRLARERLEPTPEADRLTLIRRLTFDLIGLPPTPEEVDAFLADHRPDAYDRLVDRLLASPHYGERWGRHWLDVVHYGDTHGYDKDKRRDHAWPYRDYVIRALNADKPFGAFLREQIAGDVLHPGDPDGIIATGFIAAGPWDFVGHVELREGTVDKLKTRALDRDDMVSNTIATFQSLTIHCARCHDHKFDPITQADYYRLQAVFAGIDRGDRPYASPARAARQRTLEQRRERVFDRLLGVNQKIIALSAEPVAPLDAKLATLTRQLAAAPQPVVPPGPSPTNGYHSAIHDQPDSPAWVQVDLGAPRPIHEIRLIPARPTDFRDTPGFGFPVRWLVAACDDPAFPARAVEVVAFGTRPDTPDVEDQPHVVRPDNLKARYIRVAASRLWKRANDYVFALSEIEVISQGENVARGRPVTALDSIEAGRWGRAALVDGFDSRAHRPPAGGPESERRGDLLYEIQQTRAARQKTIDAHVPPALRAERDALSATLRALDEQIKALPAGETVYAALPRPPRPIQVLDRGEVDQPRAEVGPGTLACLPGLESTFPLARPTDEGARRAALADWLARPDNVLTWRSIVNRVWHYHFGRGIVDTPNDFGRNGSKPTHPELLDWLAVEFREGGGSLKRLHKLIVTSAAYRRSSRGHRAGEAADADNRYLWRQNRRRLDAECVRDGVLAVSGTLDPRMGGPGFDLFRFKDDHSPIYDHTAPGAADNPAVRRRTIYRFIVRSVPNPFLECMDCADPNLNTPVRPTTITALQALALLNDRFILSQSSELAHRLERETADPSSRIDRAYRLALARPPTAAEKAALAAHAARFGLAQACRVLLNTNEFMFID